MIYALQSLMIGLAFWQRYAGDGIVLGSYILISCTILSSFYFLGRCGWYLRRPSNRELLDAQEVQVFIQGAYRWHQLIKFLFRGLHFCLAVVLLLLVFSLGRLPVGSGLLVSVGLLWLLVMIIWRPAWSELVMRGIFYLLVPILVFLAELGLSEGVNLPLRHSQWFLLVSLGFCTMVVFALLVLRFTRREGYRSTPLDFLILVVAIMVPVVIPRELFGVVMGVVVVKVLALFFVFEVIVAESRHPNRWLESIIGGILLLVGGKSLFFNGWRW